MIFFFRHLSPPFFHFFVFAIIAPGAVLACSSPSYRYLETNVYSSTGMATAVENGTKVISSMVIPPSIQWVFTTLRCFTVPVRKKLNCYGKGRRVTQ